MNEFETCKLRLKSCMLKFMCATPIRNEVEMFILGLITQFWYSKPLLCSYSTSIKYLLSTSQALSKDETRCNEEKVLKRKCLLVTLLFEVSANETPKL